MHFLWKNRWWNRTLTWKSGDVQHEGQNGGSKNRCWVSLWRDKMTWEKVFCRILKEIYQEVKADWWNKGCRCGRESCIVVPDISFDIWCNLRPDIRRPQRRLSTLALGLHYILLCLVSCSPPFYHSMSFSPPLPPSLSISFPLSLSHHQSNFTPVLSLSRLYLLLKTQRGMVLNPEGHVFLFVSPSCFLCRR